MKKDLVTFAAIFCAVAIITFAFLSVVGAQDAPNPANISSPPAVEITIEVTDESQADCVGGFCPIRKAVKGTAKAIQSVQRLAPAKCNCGCPDCTCNERRQPLRRAMQRLFRR